MTKQPPFVTKLRLSKLCRGIIALAVIKLCVLVAIVADIPLPELRWETSSQQQAQQTPQPSESPTSSTLVLGNPEHSLLASAPTAKNNTEPTAANAPTSPATAPEAARYADANEPQGSAAAAAAARLRPMASRAAVTMPVSSLTKEKEDSPVTSAPNTSGTDAIATPAQSPAPAVQPEPSATVAALTPPAAPTEAAPLVSTGVEAQTKNTDETSWWHNMRQLTHLPVPQLGVSQVAHAASLDTPPAPTVAPAAGASPFTPPGQQIMRGQDNNGAPLPPRSTTARPLPTGNSDLLPKSAPAASNSVDPMVSPVTPPVPNVNAYVPPEDPNRKQQDMARREQEILALKQQMEQRLKELEGAEARVKGMIKDANDTESKKVSGLIAVYANMKPKQAAQTLQSLDERVAVKILTGLTPKQAGEILSYADPKITAKLTELMTRMQMQP